MSSGRVIRLLGASVFVAFVATAAPARAYNGPEHIRFPDQAYQILNIMRRGAFYAEQANRLNQTNVFKPLTALPAGADPAAWAIFRAKALAAPAKLDNVLIRLSQPGLGSPDCGGAFPSTPSPEFYKCRLGELSFAPRRNWGQSAFECYLRRGYLAGGADQNPSPKTQVVPFFQDLPTNYTGAGLGIWATTPDDANQDTQLWVRPTNLVLAGETKAIAQTVIEGALDVALIPLVCLGELLFSGDSCIDDAMTVSHTIDPVTVADEIVGVAELATFGNLNMTSDDAPFKGRVSLPGLWHFINFSRSASSGTFNNIPGIKLTVGGPHGTLLPDGLDMSIIAAAELFGITVQPWSSEGVENYSPFSDGQFRNLNDWIGATMGHTEFEPLDNLASWGWQNFVAPISGPAFGSEGIKGGGAGANGLGWVLHAIGDAACPHHTIGALGWGHALWEKFSGLAWQGAPSEAAFQEESVTAQYPRMVTAMERAFRWWKFMDDLQKQTGKTGVNDVPVGALIEALAAETHALPFSSEGRAFKEGVSLDYAVGSSSSDKVFAAYADENESLRDLALTAIGASIAFLVKAADAVPPASGLPPSSPCFCAPGTARSGFDFAGKPFASPDGTCLPCGTGAFAQLPKWLDGQCVAVCPADKPTVQAGICVATGACPPDSPYVKNGSCAASCCPVDPTCPAGTPVRENGVCSTCSTPLVANYRECVASCPSGQVVDTATMFCKLPGAPVAPAANCGGASSLLTRDGCVPRAGRCARGTDCCSRSCRLNDGVCLGSVGESCHLGQDCVSGQCEGAVGTIGAPGTCVLSTTGQPCTAHRDCGSGICSPGQCSDTNTTCDDDGDCPGSCSCVGITCKAGPAHGICRVNSDCLSGICTAGQCQRGPNDPCTSPADCDGFECLPNGKCCAQIGQRCQVSFDCCSIDNRPHMDCLNDEQGVLRCSAGAIVP